MLVGLIVGPPFITSGDPLFDDATLTKIATAIVKLGRCPSVDGCEVDRFRFYSVDVNGDGEQEYIVVSLDDCGSGRYDRRA